MGQYAEDLVDEEMFGTQEFSHRWWQENQKRRNNPPKQKQCCKAWNRKPIVYAKTIGIDVVDNGQYLIDAFLEKYPEYVGQAWKKTPAGWARWGHFCHAIFHKKITVEPCTKS